MVKLLARSLNIPIFLMSIDTEMLWGGGTPSQREFLSGKGKEDRDAIADLLTILRKREIRATWAIVGHLFLDHCNQSSCQTAKNMSTYNYCPDGYWDPYSCLDLEPMYYGKDVVERILIEGDGQEIGYHSYSHPTFTEISREMAEDELVLAKEIERSWGIKLRSFVFPRNKVAHVDLLKKHGFSIFRGELAQRRKEDMNPFRKKFNGALDKFSARSVEPVYHEGIWEIPGSMPFADVQLPSSVPLRARSGLKHAMSTKGVFHICLHPWNLVLTERLKDDLDRFLGHVASQRDAGRLEVMTMGEYATRLSDA